MNLREDGVSPRLMGRPPTHNCSRCSARMMRVLDDKAKSGRVWKCNDCGHEEEYVIEAEPKPPLEAAVQFRKIAAPTDDWTAAGVARFTTLVASVKGLEERIRTEVEEVERISAALVLLRAQIPALPWPKGKHPMMRTVPSLDGRTCADCGRVFTAVNQHRAEGDKFFCRSFMNCPGGAKPTEVNP